MTVATENPEDRELIQRVYDFGQGHVFRFWDELNDASRQKLLNQLKTIDFQLLAELYEDLIKSSPAESFEEQLEPAEFTRLPQTQEEMAAFEKAKQVGEEALRRGRVAAFQVAGGQGSRLGFDGPKGMFPITPIKNKSLFQHYAEYLQALGKRYDVIVPWYIMTSETNHQPTVDFFESQNYFNLNPGDVFFFQQEMIPALDPKGRLILDAKDHIFSNPNGHGGSLTALKKSGALDDMKRRGVDLMFYFQVDNVLVKICDPVFLGFHIQEDAQMSAKIVSKREPAEKVGVLGTINGKLGLIEYSDLPEKEQNARKPDGSLKFRAGNIATHVFDVEFIEQENRKKQSLPWHLAHKKIPYLDQEGKRIEPDEPNGYKFEMFVFDALQDTTSAAILEVKREREFSPVKNAEGKASPQTARRDLVNFYGTWLEKAGIDVPRDADGNVEGAIEISPLYALDEQEFAAKVPKDLTFDGKLYLGEG